MAARSPASSPSDLLADGLDLPFPDDTFTLALSQAVLEHVTEPQRYVNELVRVLRPGGLLWIEAAFIQPIHQAPTHYFNITPFGLEYLCRDLDIVEAGTIGWFSETIGWLCRESGVPEPRIIEPPDHLRREAASGVSLLGRKR